MITRTVFEIDCNPVIQECGCLCEKCAEEIESILTGKYGVSKVYLEELAEEGKIIVEHDLTVATVDQLIETLKILPSSYEGFFIPIVITE